MLDSILGAERFTSLAPVDHLVQVILDKLNPSVDSGAWDIESADHSAWLVTFAKEQSVTELLLGIQYPEMDWLVPYKRHIPNEAKSKLC